MPCASRGSRNASFHSGSREVDVHRLEARAAHPLERGGEVGHLEREVVRAGAVPRDEAGEEVVLLGRPRFEQLDGHAVAVGVADASTCIGRKPIAVTAEDDRAAERAGEEAQRVGGVGRRERDVVEVVVVHGLRSGRWPRRARPGRLG